MITYIVGDLFRSPAHVLVNTVNTVGVMGKGIAKTFKQAYPEMFEQYVQHCETNKLTVGKLSLYKTPNKWVLNFPTKTTWRQPSRVEYIEQGLIAFVNGYAQRGVTSIAFPALGCGNGELNWEHQVRPLMEKYLKPLPIDIFIYVYRKDKFVPEHKNIKETVRWLRQDPESLGFSEVWIDLQKRIGDGAQLESFYKNQPFRVTCTGPEEGITVDSGDKSDFIYYDELLEFWDIVRSYGFGLPSVVPAGIFPFQDFLLSLFSELPYCSEILASKDYSTLNASQARGLQYIPRPSKENNLFSGSPKQLIAE